MNFSRFAQSRIGKYSTFGVFALGIGFCALQRSSYAKDNKALNPDQFQDFTLSEIYPVSHNTNRLRFKHSDHKHVLGLDVASCIVVKAPIGENGKDVIRPYTPTSSKNDRGFFDLVVKEYPQGVMSKHLNNLQPGDKLQVKGPISKLPYKANMKKKIGMVAGGTGITPMFQLLEEILSNPDDKTEVTLIFANVSEDDILLKQELDAMQYNHDNFHVYYSIDKQKSKNWRGGVGFVSEEMLKDKLPPPSNDNLVVVCGPPGMMKHISGDKAPDYSQGELSGLLKKIGYTSQQVFKF